MLRNTEENPEPRPYCPGPFVGSPMAPMVPGEAGSETPSTVEERLKRCLHLLVDCEALLDTTIAQPLLKQEGFPIDDLGILDCTSALLRSSNELLAKLTSLRSTLGKL
jgi:hypothetical protein